MTNSKEIAQKFVETCKGLGWTYNVREGAVLTIYKEIRKGSSTLSMNDYITADMEYWSILGIVPRTSPGSIWGTDGGGGGAIRALNRGVFTMNMSGGSKRVLNAIAKMK